MGTFFAATIFAASSLAKSSCDRSFVFVPPFDSGAGSIFRVGVCVEPGEKNANATCSHRHAGIGRPVVEANRISICVDGLAAGKYNVVHIAVALVRSLGSKHPGISPLQTDVGLVQIKEGETQTVNAP